MSEICEVGILVGGGDWPDEPELLSICGNAIKAAISAAELSVSSYDEVSFLFTNDDAVRALNAQWRDQDKPTNVLSFPQEDDDAEQPSGMLGDIVLAQETIAREALEARRTLDQHLNHLIIHGFLHLFGYDHQSNEDAEEMEALEIKALEKLGIANPYADH
ncbi:MAG: rRNA maturation RNase YbeY [Pseudomonadota bacterium]